MFHYKLSGTTGVDVIKANAAQCQITPQFLLMKEKIVDHKSNVNVFVLNNGLVADLIN
jgi:hypothetical protein